MRCSCTCGFGSRSPVAWVTPHGMHVLLLQLMNSYYKSLPPSFYDLKQRMMRHEPSQRPCLGTVLLRKCRAENGGVCDGSSPEQCLYGSADSPSELGACFMHQLGVQRRVPPAATREMHP